MNKKIILLIIFLIGGIIFLGQRLLKTSDTNLVSNTSTEKAQKGKITSTIAASGKVQTGNFLAITTSVNGIVKKVYVKEGDTVVKNQKIMDVTLDSEGEQSLQNAYSSYLKAKNSADSAKTSLISLDSTLAQKKKAFDDTKKNYNFETSEGRLAFKVAEADFEVAQNNYDQQKLQIDQQNVALGNAWLAYLAQSPTILAPDSGVIANVVAVEGSAISNSVSNSQNRTTQTVAAIKKPGSPIISLDITELDINKVIVGQKVEITLSSILDQTFMGTVAGIDKVGASQSGVSNYPVIVKLDAEDDKVLPNMNAQAKIIIASKDDVLYIPTAALTNTGNKNYVTIIQDGNEINKEVEIGISDDNNTEILSGLNEGDEVLITALPTSGFTNTASNQNRQGGNFGAFSVFRGR